jgi:hypothetical protein
MQMLNPGIAKSGHVFFDAPRGHYVLQVSGGYESDQKSFVNLNSEPRPETWIDPYKAPSAQTVEQVLGSSTRTTICGIVSNTWC